MKKKMIITPQIVLFLLLCIILLSFFVCKYVFEWETNKEVPKNNSKVNASWTGTWQYTDNICTSQIRIYNETDEGFYFCFYAIEGPDHRQGDFCAYAYARKQPDETAEFKARFLEFSSLKSMEGILSLAQDSLSLTYDNLVHNDGFWTEPPVGFSRVLDADADKVLFGEPYTTMSPS